MRNVSTSQLRLMQYWAGITVRRAVGVAGQRIRMKQMFRGNIGNSVWPVCRKQGYDAIENSPTSGREEVDADIRKVFHRKRI